MREIREQIIFELSVKPSKRRIIMSQCTASIQSQGLGYFVFRLANENVESNNNNNNTLDKLLYLKFLFSLLYE